MKTIISKIPLHLKLIFWGIVPIAVLLYFSYVILLEKKEQITTTKNFITRLNTTSNLNSLFSELQQERRLSLSKLLHKGHEENLVIQREKVDATIQRLKEGQEENLNSGDYTFLSQLPSWRKEIDKNTLDVNVVVKNYQMLIDRMRSKGANWTDNPTILREVGDSLQVNSMLSNMTNYISLMRLRIYFFNLDNEHLHTNQFHVEFPVLYKLFKSYEQELLNSNSSRSVDHYQKIREQGELKLTLDYFDRLAVDPSVINQYSAEEWWEISATGMDKLQHTNEQLIESIRAQTNSIYNREVNVTNIILFALVTLSILFICFLYFLITSLADQLRTLERAAHVMALGETDIHLPKFPKDAMGNLAQSFIQIDRNNKKVAFAASQIGKNIFDTPFQVRGKQDELGNAILKMRNSLQRFSTENENEIWIQTGLSSINNVLIGKKNLPDTCRATLTAVVNYLKADIGTLYLLNSTDVLELQSTHAILNKKVVPRTIHLGENRLGEAAINKTPVFYDHVPEDYLSIGSSTGKSPAAHLLILPLVQNEQLEGVIEIASFMPFPPLTTSLVKQLSVTIAIALHSIKSRLRLQELFEETQAQAEELQAQHSELENLNTELEAQTQKLQASEEELKVQQEELMQSNQELEERSKLLEERNQIIVERTLEVQKKAEELEESTRYKSEFLANMSHELRTPLNSILLLSRLLGENSEKRLSEEQVEFAEVIQSSGQNLLTLIDEILDLSKIEAGKMTMEFKGERVEEILASMNSLFGPMAREKTLAMDFQVAADVPGTVITDRLRLEQILKNLLSNALKFTPKGFISVRVARNPKNGDFIDFQVKDSGIGIPEDKQEHIFGAFQQADGSTRRKFGGTGLGLSISRELARLLGGTLTLVSKQGEGSEFTLSIPVDQQVIEPGEELKQESPAQEADLDIQPSPLDAESEERFLSPNIPEDIPDDRNSIQKGDRIILIIEDDTAFAKSLLTFSQKKGYKGLVAVRGDKAIELAVSFQPQAILLDLQLPVKDGWQVMAELKGNPYTRHIPVHMMSSYEIKHESLMKGAIDFINKPIALEQMNKIFTKLENALARDPKKVLIVEENLKHAQALAYFLESFDVKAEIKNSIPDSISALSGQEINCVILDMGLPDANAYKMLETVKENPGLESLPIIVFTGENLSRKEEQRIKQYADSIVVKTAHSYQRILDEVTLFLHLIEENNAAKTAPKKKDIPNKFNETLTGKTVLVADDDIRNIFSLTKALEGHGMHVLTASDGKEALQVLGNNLNKVDIILMDMMMPEMDGYETIAQIRKDPQLSKLPVLAVTAKAMMGDREKCIKAGASDYISKPVDIDQLISLLRVWLYH